MQRNETPMGILWTDTPSTGTMFLIVFSESLRDEVIDLLDRVGVPGFTETQKVTGRGQRGRHFDNPIWPGADGMIYVVTSPEQSPTLASALSTYSHGVEKRSNNLYGVHVFTWPCAQVI